NGKFTPLSKEEYADVLKAAIQLKPKHITIQRITAGINDNTLLAPNWCGWDKNKMMAFLTKELTK
ncbi:MAG: TIGR01212 family radical SAM protein, partial [Sulfurovaceae bacterium]|nr:TIGR01212 family radical SAM protein [Sulfurovaceae bacterium]